MTDFFETVSSLDKIYSQDSLSLQTERYKSLDLQFHSRFPQVPVQFYARSPGRVNIIGEHVDYSLYSVLPMALSDKDIVMAVNCSSEPISSPATIGKDEFEVDLHVCNLDAGKFPDRHFAWTFSVATVADKISIDATKHEWSNYFLSGFKGALMHILSSQSPAGSSIAPGRRYSIKLLIDGTVPTGAGVSSSAAFVCCSALATVRAFNFSDKISKKQLTELAIVSERFVGVDSGGMDQSASIFGTKNTAVLIDFYPQLQITAVPFPRVMEREDEPVFVVAHSLVVSDKHVTAPVCYNLRVVEMRFASALLAKFNGITEWQSIKTLRYFQTAFFKKETVGGDLLIQELSELLNVIEKQFGQHKDGYTMAEISGMLEMSAEQLTKHYIPFPIRAEKFQLYKRCKHVISESIRVLQFSQICQSTAAGTDDVYLKLGQLMNESQQSCSQLFECSCPELDQLTAIARKNGAIGSRLTGAGWGGCTVSLIKRKQLTAFLEALKRDWYQERLTTGNIRDVLFYSPPGRGAVYFVPQ